jgi:hypothetical protein
MIDVEEYSSCGLEVSVNKNAHDADYGSVTVVEVESLISG